MSRAFKIALATIVLAGLVGAAGGSVIAWSGLYNVGATAGHAPPTQWLLHYVMRRSVKQHAASITEPPLDDPVWVIRGAAHYRTGCAPCHGSPDDARSAIERHATPPPPSLPAVIDNWRTRELFWIVKHGIKMTAMPAWPAQARDDEVWALVAFLRRLPDLDAAGYRRLALGEVGRAAALDDATGLSALDRPGGSLIANCARCHGYQGEGRSHAFPRLAGLDVAYIALSLRAFRDGGRKSGIMQSVASSLTDDEISELAAFYAAKHPGGSPPPAPGPQDEGAAIARHGTAAGKAPPCLSCHGLDAATRNPVIPSLAQQDERYLMEQLRLFRDGKRENAAMNTIARGLTEDQMRAVAAYFAAQPVRQTASR